MNYIESRYCSEGEFKSGFDNRLLPPSDVTTGEVYTAMLMLSKGRVGEEAAMVPVRPISDAKYDKDMGAFIVKASFLSLDLKPIFNTDMELHDGVWLRPDIAANGIRVTAGYLASYGEGVREDAVMETYAETGAEAEFDVQEAVKADLREAVLA